MKQLKMDVISTGVDFIALGGWLIEKCANRNLKIE
jgi:hypothetical protein